MKRCPKCNCEWPDSANFCPVDGAPLQDIAPPSPTDAETRMMDAVESPEAAPTPEPAPAQPSKPTPKKEKRFSETSWFMAAQSPEDLSDVEVGMEAEVATEKYLVEGEHSTQVRKKFSLRKDASKSKKGGPADG